MHSKRNHKKDEKTTLRMGENIGKQSDWQRINLQNIQTVHAAQYKKKKSNFKKKWVEDLHRHFSKKYIQMTKNMKRYSISLIREMQIKSTMRHHFIMVRMVIIIKKKKNLYTNNKCCRGCGEKGTSYTV